MNLGIQQVFQYPSEPIQETVSIQEVISSIDEFWTRLLIQEDCLLKEIILALWQQQEPLIFLPAWLQDKGIEIAEVPHQIEGIKKSLEKEDLNKVFCLENDWFVLKKFSQRCRQFLNVVKERFLKEKVSDFSRSPSASHAAFSEASLALSSLNTKQQQAVLKSLTSKLFVLTGGPGTGKTYTSKKIIEAQVLSLGKPQVRVALLAPTGKAMVRLKQSIGELAGGPFQIHFEAMTLHRFLYNRDVDYQLEKDPLAFDIVLVDESSMVTLTLFETLFQRVHESSVLILMGDPYQLPPVQSMPIFERLVDIAKAADCWVHLDECLRVENRALFDLSCDILQYGKGVNWQNLKLKLQSELLSLESYAGESSFMKAIEAVFPWTKLLADSRARFQDPVSFQDPAQAFKLLNKWICLCSTKSGPMGCDRINQLMYQKLRFELFKGFQSREFQSDLIIWVPVMATVNQKELERVNGEMGLLTLPSFLVKQTPSLKLAMAKASQVLFYSEDGLQTISPLRLEGLAPAWAMTIHKSQGSEFEHVEALIAPASSSSDSKALLYTACTRAKKSLRIWQQKNCLEEMLAQPEKASWLFSA